MYSNVSRKAKSLRRGILSILSLLLLFFTGLNPLLAQSKPDPRELIKQVDDLSDFSGKDFSAVFTIVTQKPGEKDSVTQARVFRRDAKKQFVILILLPEVNKGQGYLREDDNVWFYDPTSRKFSHSSMKENIQNTKAKNSDFTLSTFAEDYTVTKMTESMVGKFPVWVLDLKARTNEVAYDRVVLYIRKDRTMLLKREDYSVNGRLMRTTAYPKYVELEGKLLPSQILIVDEVNKGEKSQMTMTEQSVSPLPDRVFTKAFLEQVSR
ncbi:MAG TPA: outer membrane lipoprotein-sorting protein [Rectinema sp.]|jgi:outer membrane lipoprotein-sorting protein|nr:outer membrane lipoprotein-sorting protein [Treponema sp.]HNP93098.1 outer membrane lipoprotein-sorting protein [Rectinema sp.]HNT59826.1 outer membrane lipoprotein-sorting protein [Rectinema sp.]HOC27145.1 outer membrane lipoprotein-sorting protein [Rectinema sp.]HOE98734.1 outer membrane lipoprotein-sorting protein [Rectinema sp.]